MSQLFVESCPACGGPAHGFCEICAAELIRVRDACPRCGLARPAVRCPLEQGPWDVEAVVAPFEYGAPLDHHLHALKYRGARFLGRAFAKLLVPTLRRWAGDVDALVAVPLAPKRLRERGYNQAHEVARPLGRALGLPTLVRGIARRAETPPQTGQSAAQRRASVANAFSVDCDLTGRRIAIVDDVVTTGATVNALAARLRAAGAVRCVVVAVARTPERAH